ncbi:MAG TPA: hypothetical protein VEK34_15300 [Methylocella sp.]|nr:hypothetical protein [Methylocella sp.]
MAAEFGHAFGLRAGGEANVTTLEAAILGLLALMISFTFAMALTRFDERRSAVLNEANAIGTAAMRARLLPSPQNSESLKLLREYVEIRLGVTQRIPSSFDLSMAITGSNEIQDALWLRAKLAMAKDNSVVPTGLFIQALNDMFDNQQKRLTAYKNRVPNVVFLALYGIALVAIGFAAYSSGTEGRRWRFPVYVMSGLVASVILLIQDIDRPEVGFIAASQQPMVDTANAVASYLAEF